MSIIVAGINHKSASIALREQCVVAPDAMATHLEQLLQTDQVSEAVILSTCNRTEIICESESAASLLPWFVAQQSLDEAALVPHWYLHEGFDAITHIMSVACGLDSMILGEPQVFGQMKAAVMQASNVGAVGAELDRLFQRVFNVAKKVRTSTAVGACPVSLASTVVKVVAKHVDDLQAKTVLVIGAGETAAFIANRFKDQDVGEILIANRTQAKAMQLANRTDGRAISLSSLQTHLSCVDVVVTATASPIPLLFAEQLSERDLLVIDVGVPRNVSVCVEGHANVTLYSIDDLREQMQEGRQGREHAAQKAREMIEVEVKQYIRWLQSLDAASTINTYRQHVECIGAIERDKALKALARGMPAGEVVEQLARALTKKLMHKPSVKIRKAGYDGRLDMLELAQELFGIE